MDDRQAQDIQFEFEIQAHIWNPSVVKSRPVKKFRSQRKEEKRPAKSSQRQHSDDNPRRLRERRSWRSLPSSSPSSSMLQGQWRPVTLKFSARGQDAAYVSNAPSSASQRTLEVHSEDQALLHSIYIHLLSQTDIRCAHPSLFFTKHVVSVHCRVGQALGLPTQTSNPELNAQYRSNSVQHLTPSSLPAQEIPSPQSMNNSNASYAPLYIAFPSLESRQAWLALMRSYAKPEVHASRAATGSDRIKNAGGLYRVWRGVTLELAEARGLVGCNGTAAAPGPLPSPTAGNTEFGAFSFSSSELESLPLMVDQDVFCEVHLDSVLAGRTTSKRVPLIGSLVASGSTPDPCVVWSETVSWEGLPAHESLEIQVWRSKSKSDKTSFSSLSTSHSNGTGASLKSSMSSGVAMISGAGKKKDRDPTLVGTVTILLPNFRRGEQVEGWWAIIPPAVVQVHGFGCCGAAELKIKMTVNEDIVMPSPAYSTLVSILHDHEMFDILDLIHSAANRNSSFFSSANPADMKQVSKHIQLFAVASGTFIPALLVSIHREITTFGSQNNTLFRNNTSTTRAMEFAMACYGKAWLEESIGKVVRRLVAENVQVVVDLSSLERRAKAAATGKDGPQGPVELTNTVKELEANVKTLIYWFQEIWTSILNARGDCPNELRLLFQKIRFLVDQRWTPPANRNKLHHAVSRTKLTKKDYSRGDSDSSTLSDAHTESTDDPSYQKDLKWQAISAFVFLRFISPAIISPHFHGLLEGLVPEGVKRTLVLVAAHLIKLATLNLNVNPEEHMRPMKTFLTNQMAAMIDFLSNISDPIPDLPSIPITAGTASQASSQLVALHLQTRLSTLPLLHRESVPDLPHFIDRHRQLSAIVSTVVRSTLGSRAAVSYAQRVERDDAGRAVLSEPASFEDLQATCFEIQTEALACEEISKKQGTSWSNSRSRSSTNLWSSSEKTMPSPSTMFGLGYGRGRYSSGPSASDAARARPIASGFREQAKPIAPSSFNASGSHWSAPISINKIPSSSAPQSPISPTLPAVPFSQRPRSSSLSSGSEFDSLFVDEVKASSPHKPRTRSRPSTAETGSKISSHNIQPSASRSDLEDSSGELNEHSPVHPERSLALPGASAMPALSQSARLPSGPVSPNVDFDNQKQVRRVSSNPSILRGRLPLGSTEDLTPKRSKGNFFTFKGLLGGKHR
ncbi:hypothetical protein FRB97_006080 [Tulasnella sp. 331]|nr:hypothetical protein FRB97_006080 [Tulasnella sp. 331]